MKLYYKIYSQKGREAEQTGLEIGKWSLIWWLFTNQFDKGVYKRRENIEIRLFK